MVGEHEHPPTMTGEHLFAVEQGARASSVMSRRIKVDAIRAALAASPDALAYADTSNMFIKTFADVILDEFGSSRVRIVHLRRDTVAVARSFRELGCYTPHNTVSRPWMYDPLAPNALAGEFYRVDPGNPTEMIVGYLVEIELQAGRFFAEHSDVDVQQVWLSDLQTTEEVSSLFEKLGLHTTAETQAAVGARQNTKDQPKADAATPAEEGFAEHVADVLGRFADAGAPVGSLVAT